MEAPNVYTSLVVTMPPLDQWDQFVSIKKLHMNPRIKRPPFPHLTLLHPFRPYSEYNDQAAHITELLSDFEPFTLSFDEFRLFENRRSTTLYLAPEESRPGALESLHDILQAAYPTCVKPRSTGFKPHIGVGFWRTRDHAQIARKFQRKYQRDWEPIQYECKEIYLLTRTSDTSPFAVRKAVHFGGSENLESFFEEIPE